MRKLPIYLFTSLIFGGILLDLSEAKEIEGQIYCYFWAVRVKPDDSTLTLSNDNLTSSMSEESILATKE